MAKIIFYLALVALLLGGVWLAISRSGGNDSKKVENLEGKTAGEVSTGVPADINDVLTGTFDCQTNADCAADEWCYVTKEFAACTKK